jgi:preprotein translocase subunit YajC
MISPTIVIIFILVCLVAFFGLVVFIGAPYVPSQKKYIKHAFDYFGVKAGDTIVDIGSGDGVVLRIASRFGATAVGYEINPILVTISKILSFRDPNVEVRLENAWLATFPKSTTLVYAFAVNRDEKRLQALLQREANRLGRPLKLICLASPFKHMRAIDSFEAYHLYIFHPLQLKKA